MKHDKVKFKLILIPSSEDEREYENLNTYEEALALSETREDTAQTFTFESERERSIFLEGVAAMEGYNGKGVAFTTEEVVEVESNTIISRVYRELMGIAPADMTTAEKKIWEILETSVQPIRS